MEDLRGVLNRLNAVIERKVKALNDPGLAIGVTNHERLLFVGNYGLANREAQQTINPKTLFQIGSISKSFTSIALLQLQEQNLIRIDEPVTRFLPWFEVQSNYAPITLRHLMSHTAGIIRGSDATISAFTEAYALRFTRAMAPPGERFHYSNSGYKVLGLVLETVLCQPIAEILCDRILTPLGMMNSEPAITNAIRTRLAVGYASVFDDRPHLRSALWVPAPWLESDTADGAISSTAEDMCCYLRALLNRGEGLLTNESFRQLTEPVIRTDDGLHGEFYSLGLNINQIAGHSLIYHGGETVGYYAHLLADLDAGLGVVALSNSPCDPENFTNLVWRELISALESTEVNFSISESQVDGDPNRVDNWGDYIGRFSSQDKAITLIAQEQYLFLEFDGILTQLEPASADVFLVPHPAFELFPLRFKRSGSLTSQEIEAGDEAKRWAGHPITAVLHGADEYLPDGMAALSESRNLQARDSSWDAFPGHYRSHNPWYSNIRVVLRGRELILIEPQGDEEPLFPIGPGLFRVGADPRSPEFIRFEMLIDGKARQINLSGGVYSRTFTP